MARTPSVVIVLLTCLLASAAAAAALAPLARSGADAPPAAAPAAEPAAPATGAAADAASGWVLLMVEHEGEPTDAFLRIVPELGTDVTYKLVHLVPGRNVLLDDELPAGEYAVDFTMGADAIVLTVGASASTTLHVGDCDRTLLLPFQSSYRGLGFGVGMGEAECVSREG